MGDGAKTKMLNATLDNRRGQRNTDTRVAVHQRCLIENPLTRDADDRGLEDGHCLFLLSPLRTYSSSSYFS